jgi:hypothetical protein
MAPVEVVAMLQDIAADTFKFNDKVEAVEGRLLKLGWTELPCTHHFAHGVYFREGVIPKGHLIVGHAHRNEELTIFFSGRLLLCVNGKVQEVVGPAVVKTPPGVRKVGYVLEEVRGGNIHFNPTDERDIVKVEEDMFLRSPTFKAFQQTQLT